MIAIIDYGIGNLHSVAKAVEKLGERPEITSDPEQLRNSRGIILPGVGSFGEAMAELERKELVPVIRSLAEEKKFFLGICLGSQLLFEKSQEAPTTKGLSLIPGEVRRLPPTNNVPHMGWNQVYFQQTTSL
ncbi:MAG TPA: imidazole glycerol phosphate synthase subunit HisH, partial [Atribacteraceae bacterium]|nr:imidazole glycerol phosphate synthase subunit HisH [Atribacteraceae bacterium]